MPQTLSEQVEFSNDQPIALRHLIDGEWCAGDGAQAASDDPARPGRTVASYRVATEEQLARAVRAAVTAAPGWDRTGPIGRGRILRRAAELLSHRVDDLAALITREQGKTLPEARAEAELSVETLHYHAAQARAADGVTYPSSHPDELIRTVRRPLGVVAAITPWNFPVQIPAWKLAPALVHGNTVVWKPASDTPAVAVAFAEILAEAGLPDGVLNLVLGPGSLGAALVAKPEVSGITFTGSVPVGRSIQAAAVPRGAKVQLELGGHNAAIVLPDADPVETAVALTAGAMSSAGQKCTATRRIIAVGDAYEPLVAALTARVEALVLGDGAAEGVDIGPLVSARARAEVESALAEAKREGAVVLAQPSSAPPEEGHFVPPTLLAGTPDLTICREEVFGPLTVVLRAADLDAAIMLANGTTFGLTASVFTCDERAARRCVTELDAGLVKVNAPTTGSELHAPFGGLKDSSFPAPREQNGDTSAEFFTWSKTAYLRTGTPARSGR
ncbi:aldehyde dehydrogenase family protein [Amycolatopsis sp. cmx-4-54]|uniref:aldehyde dehydrogenase family protein n=1 Tax=Amycolatopsis sp. cmx-4-54 TaxID=2790936 RepID=UPI003978465F